MKKQDIQKKVKDNLVMTVSVAKKKKKSKIITGKVEPVFLLIGYVPVTIVWNNKKSERIALADRIKIERFKDFKKIIGKQMSKEKIKNKLKDEWVDELIKVMISNINKVIKDKKLYGKKFKEIKF